MIKAFLPNLMALWTFVGTNPWYNTSLKFLMCIIYIFSHANGLQFPKVFQFSFFEAKRINHCEGHLTFQDIEYQIQENILNYYLQCSFL